MSGLKELCMIGISSASPKLCLKNRNYPYSKPLLKKVNIKVEDLIQGLGMTQPP